PPHPRRPRPYEGKRVPLRSLDVQVRRAGEPLDPRPESLDDLVLGRRAIGVLGEQRAVVAGRRVERHKAVTHRSHTSTSPPQRARPVDRGFTTGARAEDSRLPVRSPATEAPTAG